jgi:SAM-dependent methyltransferase
LTGETATRKQRSLSFGAIADQYDRHRPDYPPRLVDDVVAVLPGRQIVEIGAGTGKATALFAARGSDITAVEPDPAMANVLRSRAANVRVVIGALETWTPDRLFDGLISAQAWHWTDPQTRWQRAASALAPGGVLAVWWNGDAWADPQLADEISAVYAAHGRESADSVSRDSEPADPWAGEELAETPEFDYLGQHSYRRTARYSAQDFVAYLATHSAHSTLPTEARRALLADVRDVALAHGDEVVIDRRTDLYLGRRR